MPGGLLPYMGSEELRRGPMMRKRRMRRLWRRDETLMCVPAGSKLCIWLLRQLRGDLSGAFWGEECISGHKV